MYATKGKLLAEAVKGKFPGASITRCERGKVDVDLILGVDSFSLDKALEVSHDRPSPTPANSFTHTHTLGQTIYRQTMVYLIYR